MDGYILLFGGSNISDVEKQELIIMTREVSELDYDNFMKYVKKKLNSYIYALWNKLGNIECSKIFSKNEITNSMLSVPDIGLYKSLTEYNYEDKMKEKASILGILCIDTYTHLGFYDVPELKDFLKSLVNIAYR